MNMHRIIRISKSILGYFWALAIVLGIPLFFVAFDLLSGYAAELPFMKIHPRYAGGETSNIIENESVVWTQNHPVFDGLWGDRREGFVQILAAYAADQPVRQQQGFDIDGDGVDDFSVALDSREKVPVSIFEKTLSIGEIEAWTYVDSGLLLRVSVFQQSQD